MKWTEEEKNYLKDGLAKGISYYDLYVKLNSQNKLRNYESVCRMARRLGTSIPIEAADSLYELMGLLDQLSTTFNGERPHFKPFPENESSVLALVLSDFHLGALVTYQGNVLYNMDVARQRINSVVEQAGAIAEEFDVDRIAIISLGDMIDNEIMYKTHAHNVCASVSDQLVAGVEVGTDIINYLNSIRPTEFYGVRGNHGRVSTIANERANWDTALYKLMELTCLRAKVNVPFLISTEEDLDFNILNWKVHARHEARQQSATPAGRAGFLGWTVIHDADLILSGHYHNLQYSSFGTHTFLQNGSLMGANDLSSRMAVISIPQQWGIIMSNKRCIKQLIPITAEEKVNE